jgi:hypothetical protein
MRQFFMNIIIYKRSTSCEFIFHIIDDRSK